MQTRNRLLSGILLTTLLLTLLFGCFPLSASAAGTKYRLKEEVTGTTRITYSYDKAGRLTQKTESSDGKVQSITEYHYYPNGELCEELWKGSCNLYMHYDSEGTLIERDDTGGIGSPAFSLPYMGDTVRTEYDSAGRITRFEHKAGENGGTTVLRYEYDKKGRILRFRVGTDRTDAYDYRPDGSFIRTRNDSYSTGYQLCITEYYNTSGQRTQCDWKDGNYSSTTYYEYDAAGHLTRQYNADGTTELVMKYDKYGNLTEEWSGGKRLFTYQNTYDKNGCLTKTVRKWNDTNQVITTYTYEKG